MKVFLKYLFLFIGSMIVLIIFYLVYNLNRGIEDYEKLSFDELPNNVKLVFNNKKDSLAEDYVFKCVSIVDYNCICNIESHTKIPFPLAFINIKTCNQNVDIDFGLTAMRFFIITDNSIFFPIVNSYSYSNYTKISEIINFKKIEYGKIDI